MTFSPYSLLMLVGILLAAWFWSRKGNAALLPIFGGGLLGAFLGAKIAWLLAEGWLHEGQPDFLLQFATGKSILGALPGGYAGVELAKKLTGCQTVTGDRFAAIAPFSILLGRIGCLLQGCCVGVECTPAWWTIRDHFSVSRWPSVPVEILFNALALAVFWLLRRRQLLPGQHFHLYLIGYGLFRFGHEFLRDTPRLFAGLSGYQFLALGVALLGFVRFRQRAMKNIHSQVAINSLCNQPPTS